MDQSCSESDRSLSPSRLLEQLEVLQALQLIQRNNHNKKRLNMQQRTPEPSSSATEIVSHFSGSTSYNTFRSLLQITPENNNNEFSRQNANPEQDISQKINASDLVEGVAMLNLSQESEFVVSSSVSSKSKLSVNSHSLSSSNLNPHNTGFEPRKQYTRKAIELDEMPILSPRQDFEALVIEKLSNENVSHHSTQTSNPSRIEPQKRSFLRRGEGMARFGVKKENLVIQNTRTLPWKKRYNQNTDRNKSKPASSEKSESPNNLSGNRPETKASYNKKVSSIKVDKQTNFTNPALHSGPSEKLTQPIITLTNSDAKTRMLCQKSTIKHPLLTNKGKTWGSILTKEQDEYLRQLKQSNYYKNFESPTKSVISDMSGDDDFINLKRQREQAEQNMFDLLEEKATQENFNLDNSFLYRFLQRAQLENSGDSTPVVLQRCLQQKPELLQIFPDVRPKEKCNVSIQSDVDTCCSDYTECSSESTCCSCKTVEESPHHNKNSKNIKPNLDVNKNIKKSIDKAVGSNDKDTDNTNSQETIVDDKIKTNVVEMNANLLATSEILKDRLKELEDEIEMFRKENANLTKMREEVDLEKQKFFEEKSTFEQKFNEEKILSEYYLSEEKEKLIKQKKIYEKYVREMRGRLNKKDKDEVSQLKNEIANLKEEIRTKDAKSTCTIARLRNQLKLMEKDKTQLQDEIEKLKKENRRIKHSNEMTRRLTNIKYLEQINKKLTTMTNEKADIPTDSNIKYKAFEIERQSRKRSQDKPTSIIPRSKSVPNINVTSKYAKYFSQRDAFSQLDKDRNLNTRRSDKYTTDDDDEYQNAEQSDEEDNHQSNNTSFTTDSAIEEANNLEKLYIERFKADKNNAKPNLDSQAYNEFFLTKDNTDPRLSNSPTDKDISPHQTKSSSLSRSPISILSNKKTSPSILNRTSVPRPQSPEQTAYSPPCPPQAISSTYSSQLSLAKTSLTPREIKKADGSKELRFPNGNVKYMSADGKYSKFVYYNGDVKENFYNEGRIKYFFAESKTFHTTYPDGLEVLEFPDGQTEKRYKDGSSEVRLPNGSVRYHDPKNQHVREEWRFPDGTRLTIAANGEQRVEFVNGQVEVHAKDHKRREFPDGTVKLVYNDGTTETRYSSGRVRVKDKHGNLIMDSAPR